MGTFDESRQVRDARGKLADTTYTPASDEVGFGSGYVPGEDSVLDINRRRYSLSELNVHTSERRTLRNELAELGSRTPAVGQILLRETEHIDDHVDRFTLDVDRGYVADIMRDDSSDTQVSLYDDGRVFFRTHGRDLRDGTATSFEGTLDSESSKHLAHLCSGEQTANRNRIANRSTPWVGRRRQYIECVRRVPPDPRCRGQVRRHDLCRRRQ
jgi:hypothetical protein